MKFIVVKLIIFTSNAFLDKYKLSINLKNLISLIFFIISSFFLEIIDKNSSVKVKGILYKSIGLYDCRNTKTKD